MNNYRRQILALNDEQLEEFVRAWVGKKTGKYIEVTRFSGPGDMGRDVVGFLSKNRHEGDWENYQCKQYGRALPTETAVNELGKVLYYAHQGEFTAPVRYFLVAPRGLNRNLSKLVYNPSEFKKVLLTEWDKYCASDLIVGTKIELSTDLRTFIEGFDFTSVIHIELDYILQDANVNSLLHQYFDAELDPPPAGVVPRDVQVDELHYISQLVEAYSEREGSLFPDHQAVLAHPMHGIHLVRQRERYYAADAFKLFYRDNTEPEVIPNFEQDLFHGLAETYYAAHTDALKRVNAVLTQAANIQATGPLARHARVLIKQGVCHHFANRGVFNWRKP